jgi:hypothetical protein
MATYEKFHILDCCIDDEQLGNNDREISVSVDTLERVNIEIGNSLTIRTDYSGVNDLRDALHLALVKLDDIIYNNRITDDANSEENKMIQAGIDAREKLKAARRSAARSEQQRVDVWDPNDPSNW